MDFYAEEYSQFQWDVHILIGGTLQASIRYPDTEAKAELAKLEVVMEKQLDVEYHEHLVGEHIDVLATNDNQERFVRNMALVALVSRLTHALRSMARSAELFSPRKKRYGNKSMREFGQLWLEYTERFGIDFNANVDRVAFVETIREVRNQIVHPNQQPI